MFWKQRRVSEIQDAKEVGGGVLVGFGSCSPLKLKDGTKEAASKAQAIAATHALHAFRIPKGKEWGGGGVGRVSFGEERWHVLSIQL